MKKLLTTFCAAFLISTQANAFDYFVGTDALYTNSRHEIVNLSSKIGKSQDANSKGYGFNAGIRQDLVVAFASAELFYDDLNLSTSTFNAPSDQGNKLTINNRYGAKLNAGLNMIPFVKPFLSFGFANIDYKVNNSTTGLKHDNSKLAPLYGVGALIDLPFVGLSLKASYDYQEFETSAISTGSKFQNHIGVAKLGVIYNF